MSPLGWVVLVAVVLVLGGVFLAGARFGASLPSAVPLDREIRRNAKALRAMSRDGGTQRDLTDLPTAVYLFFGRHQGRRGALLYVGIAADPAKRASQHAGRSSAPMKQWWPDVERVEAWWLNDRHIACAVEWALIKYLEPPYNTAPGGQDDAYCRDLPPITPARFRLPAASISDRLGRASSW